MRFKFDRSFYVPSEARDRKVSLLDLNAEIYRYERNDRFYALGFSGKRNKPDFDYRFANAEQREKYIDGYIEGLRQSQEYKAKRRKERKAFQHSLKVGDILYSSWGYDQTNIDYYEVTRVSGKSVWAREIGCTSRETGWLTGASRPAPGQFIGPEKRYVPQEGNALKVRSFAYAYPIKKGADGQYSEKHWSAYH